MLILVFVMIDEKTIHSIQYAVKTLVTLLVYSEMITLNSGFILYVTLHSICVSTNPHVLLETDYNVDWYML